MNTLFVSFVGACLVATAPAALADDPVKDLLDLRVPALKDGSRMSVELVERTILEACARRKFHAVVVEPGMISARWEHRGRFFEVTIPFNESTYSIRYQDSERMDYNPARHRIDDAYNDYVAGLSEHIEAGLHDALDRFKKALNPSQRVARIRPRNAV